MISRKSMTPAALKDKPLMKFIALERGKKAYIALIPGWAADYRIFSALDLEFNYLLPINFSPFNFTESLLDALKEHNIERVSLFGHSLGGFVAAEFAAEHPDLV